MRAAAVSLGILAALITGVVVAFTLGEIAAVAVFLTFLGTAAYAGAGASAIFVRRFAALAVTVLLAGTALVAWQAAALVYALSGTAGTSDAPDSSALAAAHGKIADAAAASSFRLELSEPEIEAVIQGGIDDDSPLSRVRARIVDGPNGASGTLRLDADFKRGGMTAVVLVRAEVGNGSLALIVESIDVGLLSLPGMAHRVLGDLESVLDDLERGLALSGTTVESVHLGGGMMVVTGRR